MDDRADLAPKTAQLYEGLLRLHVNPTLGDKLLVDDVSVVAIAERLGVTQIATIDRRDFTLIRPQHVSAFILLPETLA